MARAWVVRRLALGYHRLLGTLVGVLAYLDHAASGPLHPVAAEAMRPWIGSRFGNPSGAHRVARAARVAIEDARDAVGALLGIHPGGVVFTSGGTEADNLAVMGTALARPGALVISAVEHPAVTEAALASGREVRVAPVHPNGTLDLGGLRPLLGPDVALVSIQIANHETGVTQAFSDIAARVRKWAPRAVLHTDAVQATLWMDVAEAAGAADAVTISGHKIGGPQGVGVLAFRGEAPMQPLLHGGGQERELRSGTQNVAAIAGLGAVAAVLPDGRAERGRAVETLRDKLAAMILADVDGCIQTAADTTRVPGHVHLRFPGVESEALLVLLDQEGICASAGAACASGALEPSPVLLAMGVDKDEARSSLRLTLGPATSMEEVVAAALAVGRAVNFLRGA
jgi:cysteine desulfurase